VSVLIPARNEERSINSSVAAALASVGVDELEVLVLDDHSQDATSAIVHRIAAADTRVRLVDGPELPAGWCGKQHACCVLAQNASFELLLFVDADVRLSIDGLARMVAYLEQSGADLVSGVPLQETQTLMEQAIIPLIHFVLLGFLPLRRMRASRNPAYGAGCGQLFLAKKSSYEKAGGHAAIRSTLHDGIKLPRSFRAAGLTTELCDATSVARCRMYSGARELWHGLAKNAIEGLGAPSTIVPSTLILVGGQVLPIVLLGISSWLPTLALVPAIAATLCVYYPRFAGVVRFRQPLPGALLHPIGVLILLAIEWSALLAFALGRSRRWKGRVYGRIFN
jgi:glycosyltransferase involved in cell wall biosynthesis